MMTTENVDKPVHREDDVVAVVVVVVVVVAAMAAGFPLICFRSLKWKVTFK